MAYQEGDLIAGGLRVINPQHHRDKRRNTYVEVKCIHPGCRCGGRQWTVREDNLRSGKVVSCGRVSKDNYKNWMVTSGMISSGPDRDTIDPELIAAVLAEPHDIVDVRTGEIIPAADIRWIGRSPEPKPGPQTVTSETAPAPAVQPESNTENNLCEVKPYLDINPPFEDAPLGFVTFSRVPHRLRLIDGKGVREQLELAGLINSKLGLTEKGRDWLRFNGCKEKQVYIREESA